MEFAASVEFHKLSSFFWNIISFDKLICSEDTIFKCYSMASFCIYSPT